MSYWLAVIIGNSRLHWALFQESHLEISWDTSHLIKAIDSITLNNFIPDEFRQEVRHNKLEILLASVVPSQTIYWQKYLNLKQIFLQDIPLRNTYSTFGIDRALAIYGAGETYNYPCLVIDGGTALTFTGVDRDKILIGGAILSGLRSQIQSLSDNTAALPEITLTTELPPRWALDTQNAIASGIIYTLTAGIYSFVTQWLEKYPDSSILLTGGDSKLLFQYLQQIYPQIAPKILVDRKLIFWGIKYLNSFSS